MTTLRELGGVLFGKTQTTALALFYLFLMCNPRNTRRIHREGVPAARHSVVPGVVPFVLGTQTMGSVIRPASFVASWASSRLSGKSPVHGSALLLLHPVDTVGFLCVMSQHASMFGVRSGSPPKQGRSISLFLTTSPRSRRKCKVSSIRP